MMKGTGTHAVGKRKSSKARVYLREGAGNIIVNGKDYKEYFGREALQRLVTQPLVLLDQKASYDIKINVSGGGVSGQAGAARHGISRALDLANEENRSVLKKAGYLTRDAREVERKKPGRHKARKRPQFSKR